MDGNGAMNDTRMVNGMLHDDGADKAPVEWPTREAGPPPGDGSDPGDRPLSQGELRELLGRAEQGDRSVLSALRRLLDAVPSLWRDAR